MTFLAKTLRLLPVIAAMSLSLSNLSAQVKLTQDTLVTPIFGFNFGTVFATDKMSSENGMHDLYPSPYLNYGVEASYKFKSNWLLSLDGSLMVGHDLNDKSERMPAVFSHDTVPIVIGTNGIDANITCFNRALSLRVGVGKIFQLVERNPNSGIVARLNCGIMQQKTIFVLNDVNAPQVQGDYARIYDHKRRGFTLSESVGYWFMSRSSNIFNFYVAFEVTECWNHSVRDFVLDDVMGLHGPDNGKYFDMLYTIKICWMFPLKGKTAYDYYFF